MTKKILVHLIAHHTKDQDRLVFSADAFLHVALTFLIGIFESAFLYFFVIFPVFDFVFRFVLLSIPFRRLNGSQMK